MGRIILFAVSVALVAAPVAAQEIGLHLGATRTTMSDQEGEDIKPDINPSGGISVGFGLSNRVGLQSGLFYATKGASFDSTLDGEDIGGGVSMQYLELPLLLRAGTASAHLLLGPVLGVNTGCEFRFEAVGVTATVSCDEAEDLSIRRFDLGLAGGAGFSAAVTGRVRVTLNATYNLGLLTIDSNGEPGKHRAISVLAGATIPIG